MVTKYGPRMPPPDVPTLSVREAAAVSGLGLTKLNQLLWGGHIPSRKIGHRRLIRRVDLEKFLDPRPDGSTNGVR